MKIKKALLLILIILFSACAFTACAKGLSAPKNLTIDSKNDLLIWDKVKNADKYVVDTGEEKYYAGVTQFALDILPAGKYSFKVKAVTESGKESAWSESVAYEKQEVSPFEMKLINANTEYEIKSVGIASGEVVIENTYKGLPITSIGDKAFANSYVSSIKLGDNIKSIGNSAFKNCSKLTAITLNEGLTEIGDYAFQSCSSLEKIEMTKTLLTLGEYAFSYCTALKSVELNGGCKKISGNAFADCRSIETLEIPSGVKEIGGYAFSGNKNLAAVVLPDGIEKIEEGAFYECAALKQIPSGSLRKSRNAWRK